MFQTGKENFDFSLSCTETLHLVFAAQNVCTPVIFMGKVPLNGLADTAFKGFLRFPVEFSCDLGGVDGVAQIVAGTVFHIDDLFGV